MKHSKFLSIVYVSTFFFVLIGSTFAYFTTSSQSNNGVIASGSARVGINLLVEPLYVEKGLIPLDDKDVEKAYAQNCIDDFNFGACQAYTVSIENIGEALDYEGTVNFTLNNIKNLNYLVLDENDEIYMEKTEIESGTDQSLGASFNLPKDATKVFKIVIWVPNFNYDQNEYDGNGNFNAQVTFTSVGNYSISGSISGN